MTDIFLISKIMSKTSVMKICLKTTSGKFLYTDFDENKIK